MEKESEKNTFFIHLLVCSLTCKWMASLLQFIFVLLKAVDSWKVKTQKIGYTPGILSAGTLDLPPENLLSYNWNTATAQKIHQVRVEQQRRVHSHRICSAFTPHLLSFWKRHQTGTGWHFDAFKIRESKLSGLFSCVAVHVCILAVIYIYSKIFLWQSLASEPNFLKRECFKWTATSNP